MTAQQLWQAYDLLKQYHHDEAAEVVKREAENLQLLDEIKPLAISPVESEWNKLKEEQLAAFRKWPSQAMPTSPHPSSLIGRLQAEANARGQSLTVNQAVCPEESDERQREAERVKVGKIVSDITPHSLSLDSQPTPFLPLTRVYGKNPLETAAASDDAVILPHTLFYDWEKNETNDPRPNAMSRARSGRITIDGEDAGRDLLKLRTGEHGMVVSLFRDKCGAVVSHPVLRGTLMFNRRNGHVVVELG